MDNPKDISSNNSPLNIGIIGFGAIGCLLSSQIPSGINIYALPRNPKLHDVQFTIETEGQNRQFTFPVWKNETLDIIIICCKAMQCLSAIDLWHRAIKKTSQIVLLQNGMGQHDQIRSIFPSHTIFAASTTEGAFKKDTHHIVHAGKGTTHWGLYSAPKTVSTETLKLDTNHLLGTHQWSDDIKGVLLAKLALNAVINPLTVKHNCLNGDLISNSELLLELKNLSHETEVFFHEAKWPLNFNLTEKVISVAKSTAQNVSSMLQDVRAHSETEIDFINGFLLKEAQEINFQLPQHQKLYTLIKSLP